MTNRNDAAAPSGAHPKPEATTSAQATAGAIAEEAKRKAGEVRREVGSTLEATAGALQDEAGGTLDRALRGASRQANELAGALRRGGDELREGDLAAVASYADRAADAVDDLGSYLSERDPRDLLADLERTARRRPLLVYGGLAALGALTLWTLKQPPTATPREEAEHGR